MSLAVSVLTSYGTKEIPRGRRRDGTVVDVTGRAHLLQIATRVTSCHVTVVLVIFHFSFFLLEWFLS